jgi:hypothetical protein
MLDGGVPGAADFEIGAKDLALDEKVFDALKKCSEGAYGVAAQFLPETARRGGPWPGPIGRADVRISLHRPPGADERFANRFVIDVKDAIVKYDAFPCPLEKVSGRLDLQPDHWECIGFVGRHNGGVIRVDGRSYPLPGKADGRPSRRDRVYLDVRGEDVRLDDEEFERALSPPGCPDRAALRRARETLALAGRMNFRAVVDNVPDQPQDLDVDLTVHGCTAKPHFFPYELQQVSGKVRYAKGRVYLTDLKARHGDSALGLATGVVMFKADGGFQARLQGIRGDAISADADLLEALPDGLRRGLKGLDLRGPATIETDMIVDAPTQASGPPTVWWDGGVRLHEASLRAGVELTGVEGQASCIGLYNGRRLESLVGNVLFDKADFLGQPLQNVHARLEVRDDSPEVLRFRDLKADLFGGSVGGEARLEFSPALKYDVVLKALAVDLDQFGKHNHFGADAKMEGPALGQLHLTGEGPDLGGLKGNGRIDVPNGKLYRLKWQLDMLKALGLRAPDRTAFEEAHAEFAIDGPQVQVSRLDLYGAAVSLRGKGTVGLSGDNLNLDFSADWGRTAQMMPPGVSDLQRAVSDQLLKIKVRGKIGDIRYEKVPAPGVVEPFLNAWGRE